MIEIRTARTRDIKGIRKLIDFYALQRRVLSKETVTLYESVQEFIVAVESDEVVGCAGLHVLWEDLAEIRTVAVAERLRRHGVGQLLVNAVVERAQSLGVKRIFCLTFETEFFGRNGFEAIEGTPVEPEVYSQLLHSYDTGIAEFLDLESVKPNTLGNTRMLKYL